MTDDGRILKEFLEENIPFYDLRKVGFFPKDMKKTDIHGQAKRICEFFGYETVFEYNAHPVYVHVSYAPGHRPLHVDESGELKEAPFVEMFGGWLHEY